MLLACTHDKDLSISIRFTNHTKCDHLKKIYSFLVCNLHVINIQSFSFYIIQFSLVPYDILNPYEI